MVSLFVLLLETGLLCILGSPGDRPAFQLAPLCAADRYFEITLTTYHTEPITSLETFNFKSKLNEMHDKSQLDVDIQFACEAYAIVNCEDIAGVIYQKYDQFTQSLDRDGGDSCPMIPTLDVGYYENFKSGKTLTPDRNTAEVLQHQSPTPLRPKTVSEALTVVSGYWSTTNKYTEPGKRSPYEEWMHRTLRLYMPYVLFTDVDNVELLIECRRNLPTLFVLRNQRSFKAYETYNPTWIHEDHVPSPTLATIWLEKINLMLLASQLTNTSYYAWVDAGLGTFRATPIPQEEWSLDVVMSLPTTRLSYAQAKGTYHSFAATVMIMHRDLIPIIHALFYKEYDNCSLHIHDWRCGSEQFLLTAVRDKFPHLFHAMSYEYGDISHLWANKFPFQKAKAKR